MTPDNTARDGLPELPEPYDVLGDSLGEPVPMFTDNQMRAYASAAIAALAPKPCKHGFNTAFSGEHCPECGDTTKTALAPAEAVGFRYRPRGQNAWCYVDHRAPDAFEIAECEVEPLFTAPQQEAPDGADYQCRAHQCRRQAGEMRAEVERLRAFALDVMEDWHEGDLDGGTRQNLAEKHGLLAAVERFAPCGESCGCSEYFTDEDWREGQSCYRMTSLLTGRPESDAGIDAARKDGPGS